MLGTKENQGIISRSVKKLFDCKRNFEACDSKTSVQLSVELLEIYNEQVRDLLASKNGSIEYTELNLKLNANEAIGNVVFSASNEADILAILDVAQKKRCVKATKSNEESSRSHLIFTINFHVFTADGAKRQGRLHICDLAGSERLNKSESMGSTLRETQHINKSLSTLSNVIEKLQEKSPHVPYRESKLTYLLQNSLGGDSKTLAIVCCNPLADHFQESLCSLRFAQKASKVELKKMSDFSV